jgi:GxxExxY protein
MDHDQIVSNKVIGAAIEVHRALGAGLLESTYQTALAVELAHLGVAFDRHRRIPLEYRGAIVGEYIPDLIVENTVVVEIKSVLRMEHVFTAQVLTYLRITGLHVGLILNFNQTVLKDGIKRIVR